ALNQTFDDLAPGELAGWRPSLIVTPMLVEDGRQLLISNLFLQPLTETEGSYVQELLEEGERQRPTGTKFAAKIPPLDMPSLNGVTGCAAHPVSSAPPGEMAAAELPPQPPAGPGAAGSRYSLNGLEFFRLFSQAAGTFTLRTAARMSASFPFVASAVDLPTSPRRRVVDAGYYDNYGVALAAAWIYRYQNWLLENTSGVVLIQIRDGISE